MPFGFNSDIHCHPSTKSFMSGLVNKRHTPFETFRHEIEDPLFRALQSLIQKLSEVELSTQSNFDRLFEGEFKVVIASITPMERGFLVTNRRKQHDFTDLLIFQTKPPFELTIKPKAINALMGFGTADVVFVRSSNYKSYFTEGFIAEYNFLIKENGKQSQKHGYTLRFVRNFTEIQQGIDSGEKAIYVIISVEGAHALTDKPPMLLDIAHNQREPHLNDPPNFTGLQALENNINTMKQLPFVPFFVTLLHHFWNGLGGHARSLNKLVGEMLSQEEGINTGITPIGFAVIKRLLSKANGPRILIDVKHMSAKSRKDYYAMLKTNEFVNQKIPIIASHAGIASKRQTLDQFIDPAHSDKDEENNPRNYLHEASINLCAEDVRTIAASGGLIGIQLDEKRISGSGFIARKMSGGLTLPAMRVEYVKVLLANIFIAVKAVNNASAWDLFAIGSDFDGLINHLDCVANASHVPVNLKRPLQDFLSDPQDINDPHFDFTMTKQEMTTLMFGLTPENIVDKIFAGNVMEFLRKHF